MTKGTPLTGASWVVEDDGEPYALRPKRLRRGRESEELARQGPARLDDEGPAGDERRFTANSKLSQWSVVLEVLNSGEKEMYAAPGEKGFPADHPGTLVGHGMTGTGSFALFLRTLFINDNGQFQWAGEEEFRGQKVLKWNYRVPITSSGTGCVRCGPPVQAKRERPCTSTQRCMCRGPSSRRKRSDHLVL